MLIIRRTEDGRLQLSNNRQSDTAVDESEARRKLHRWGHTDLSINKALSEMRSIAGEVAGAGAGWRVLRPSDAAETAEPRSAVDDGANEAARPAPSARRKRSRKAAHPPVEQPVREVDAPASSADKAQSPEVAEADAAPVRKARGRGRARATAEPPSDAAAPQETAAEPAATPAPVRKASRRRVPKAVAATAGAPEPPAPVPSAAPEQTVPERRQPRPRRPAAGAPAGAVEAPSALELALSHFRDGAAALRRLENEVLPFAREPWTDLRDKAEFIVACLQGKKRPGG